MTDDDDEGLPSAQASLFEIRQELASIRRLLSEHLRLNARAASKYEEINRKELDRINALIEAENMSDEPYSEER